MIGKVRNISTHKIDVKLITILFIGIIFICYLGVKINIKLDDKKNRERKQLEEAFTNLENNQIVHNVYWTGGFDSTYRLCEMLVKQGKTVQPIYVSMVLDNDCESEETCNKLWLRRNRKEERTAMKKIREMLAEKFPFTKKTLLPVLEIDKGINDNMFNHQFEQLFYSDNLWPKKRRKHQYLFLSKYAYYHKKPIDIGVLGIHQGSKFANFLKEKLIKTNENYIISDKSHALGYLNFPLYGKTKKQLLEEAKRDDFEDILKQSWSCWFPRNGKPCKVCPMCKERIVEHPN